MSSSTGIPGGVYVKSVESATSLTLSHAAVSSGSVSLTFNRGRQIQNGIAFERGNLFAENNYHGPWHFVPYETAQDKTLAEWKAAPWGQDAGSTIDATSPVFDVFLRSGPIAHRNIADRRSAPAVPGIPTGILADGGDASASVSFTEPTNDGNSQITGYTATASPGGATGTGLTSPITVSGLTNGVDYTFTVHATNAIGNSPESGSSNSVTPAAPVLPSDLAGLVIDIDPATLTQTADAPVSSVGPTGGAAQATSGNQPVLKLAILNGKPVIRFDGVNDFLTLTGTPLTMNSGGAMTLFIVAKITPTAGEQWVIARDSDSLGRDYAIGINGTSGPFVQSGGAVNVITGSVLATGFHVLAVEINVADYWRGYVDGSPVQTVTTSNPSSSSTASTDVGRRSYTGFNGYAAMDLARLFAFNRRLTTQEIADMHTHITDTYGPLP